MARILSWAMWLAVILGGSGTFSSPIAAQPIVRPAPPAAKNQPGDVELQLSKVYAFVDKTGLGHQHGVVGKLKSGKLNLLDRAPSGELVFDLATFTADTDEARKLVGLQGSTDAKTQQEVNQNMLGPEVLNVRQFPTATFALKRCDVPPGTDLAVGGPIMLHGQLTLRGQTKNVAIPCKIVRQGNYLHLTGSFPLVQSQYGLTPFRKTLGAVGVADQLTVSGDLYIIETPLGKGP